MLMAGVMEEGSDVRQLAWVVWLVGAHKLS